MTSIEQVKEFHQVFEHPIGDIAKALSIKRGKQRADYMSSEIEEFKEAVEKEDLVEQVDACLDVIYFALGTLVELGVTQEFEDLFKEVHSSNMSKICKEITIAKETARKYREEGKTVQIEPIHLRVNDRIALHYKVFDTSTNKILKSLNYKKPDLKSIIDG